MGKKKAFIDKKKATTFTLVYAGESDTEETSDEEDKAVSGQEQPLLAAGGDHANDGGGQEAKQGQGQGSSSSSIRRVLVPVDEVGNAAASMSSVPPPPASQPPSWLLAKMGLSHLEPELPVLEEAKRKEILELGFPDDGYDYTRHLREARPDTVSMVTAAPAAKGRGENLFALEGNEGEANVGVGIGVVDDPDGEVESKNIQRDVKLVDARSHNVKAEISEEEQGKYDLGNFPVPDPSQRRHRQVGQKYVSSTLAEIEQIMEDIELQEETEFGDLQEDFLLLATEGGDEEEEDDGDGDWQREGDDEATATAALSEEEIQRLRREASLREAGTAHGREIMEECFDQLVDEYDTLEIGDLEDADLEQTQGRFNLASFDNILDEFISDKKGKDYVVYEKVDGSKAPAAAAADPEAFTEAKKVVRYDLDDETKVLSGHTDLELKEKTRELAIRTEAEDDGGGLVGERDRIAVTVKTQENWDCESVLSMVSNLDNHPALLSSASAKPRKHRNPAPIEEVAEDSEEEEEDATVLDDGAFVRKKGETAEEKKARKQAVKQAKREARARKKEKKIEYKHIKLNKQQQQLGSQGQVSIRPY
ncbi:hypothetical protein HOP50_13g69900 [Chloropicon primus]|uniref:Protein LTV1 homolog n=2 Tax=Chloropicon primus TaxID=1764295 RepID=A0A5B8MVS4_9CHLO|nr:hypothetical protein A3770_13p69690 [Chloropicon primus]UPR03660.1 hypothetical protein HOP50_13g69900 [Chloropicon primus]|eukprot:QDZ24451.1 hypothetical protein A3770_13p69690 [Chloropicon primus]